MEYILDKYDKAILEILQADATKSLILIANKTNLSKTAVWNRIQRMQNAGVIIRQSALLNPQKIGLKETFFVTIKTSHHDADWFEKFINIIQSTQEITEAHRLAGEKDYLLKVQVLSTREFDTFYKGLVSKIHLFDVTSNLSMESIKSNTILPITANK